MNHPPESFDPRVVSLGLVVGVAFFTLVLLCIKGAVEGWLS